MNEICSLSQVSEAYDRMMSGKARFRVVLRRGNEILNALVLLDVLALRDQERLRIRERLPLAGCGGKDRMGERRGFRQLLH